MNPAEISAITVIIPTFNRARIIKTAVESVTKQTFKYWQLLIVDDGSTDNTEQIVRGYADKRISYLKKKNGGVGSARNYGWQHAKTKWIMYLDSDDELLPNCVEVTLNYLEANPQAVFGFPRADRKLQLFENGKLVKEIDDSIDTPASFSIENIFNRRAGFSVNGLTHLNNIRGDGIAWDENLSLMEDWELMLSIGAKYPDGFVYVDQVLQKYRQKFNADNLVSKTTYSDWADAFDYIYKKHKDDKTLKHQTWYPSKANKWRRRQAEFKNGKRPAYTYHYFS